MWLLVSVIGSSRMLLWIPFVYCALDSQVARVEAYNQHIIYISGVEGYAVCVEQVFYVCFL